MAGRILPVALAAILGVSIGMATFDGEFKEQRRKRLQEEYEKEVAAAASAQPVTQSQSAVSSMPETSHAPLPTKPEQQIDQKSSTSWSSLLGLWAWQKNTTPAAATSHQTSPVKAAEDTQRRS